MESRPRYAYRTLSDLSLGDHICCVFETREHHDAMVRTYVRAGLQRRERVLCIADNATADGIAGLLHEDGLDVAASVREGRLRLLTGAEAYYPGGSFDPAGMLDVLEKVTAEAVADGFTGARGLGEMTWALRGVPGSERLIEYESRVNELLPRSPFAGLCLYDRSRFSADILLRVLSTHPTCIVDGEAFDNFYYIPPEEFLRGRLEEATLEQWISNLRERKQAEKELHSAMQEAVQLREEFIAIASHDLRGPVTSLQLLLQQALRRSVSPELNGMLDRGLMQTRKLTEMLNGLLDVSRMQAGKLALRREKVALDAAVNEVLEVFRPQLREQGYELSLRIDGWPVGWWDRLRLQQLVHNLVSNAVKYGEGKPIDVSVQATATSGILAVHDRGCGMTPAQVERLFEPFERVESGAPGFGFGLYVARRIVETHGGTIQVWSEPGRGTTFRVELPLS